MCLNNLWNNNPFWEAGPIAERSKSYADLDRSRGDPGSNPSKDGEQRIIEGYYSHD